MAASSSQELMLDEWSVVSDHSARLTAEVALERDVTPLEAGELKAVLSVVAPATGEDARAPLRLVAVLDKSGSMQGEKLRLVRQTMLCMLRHLSERDALGIVEYDTNVRVAAPLTKCNQAGRARLEAALAGLKAGSQTNLSGGLLKGLELHKRNSEDASAAAGTQTPLQRFRLGNSYRRLSQEEAEAREHFGDPNAPLPQGAERVHEWTMELRFDSSEDEALVEKVVYGLHPTFREPVVEVTEAPFRLTRFGWGSFVVTAKVHLKDGRVYPLTHQLSFAAPETLQPVLLPLREIPAGVDYFVEGTKRLRVTSLQRSGDRLEMSGVSFGSWASTCSVTVPPETPEVAARVVSLFEGRGVEETVEFTSPAGGESLAFVRPEGFRKEVSELEEETDKSLVRATFLFTDGMANVGITSPETLCQAAQALIKELGDRQCKVSTFGFGSDHNADLLRSLAEVGQGMYSFIEGEDRIGEAFGELLGGLLSTTHQNVSLSLELAPGVSLNRAFTTFAVEPKPPASGTVTIELEDLFAEERRDILVSLSLPQVEAEGLQSLGCLQAKGFSVLGKRTETATPLALQIRRVPTTAGESALPPAHPQVERHWNRHVTTEALQRGRSEALRGNLGAARSALAEAAATVSGSRLAAQGDELCQCLFTDIRECLHDMQDQGTYTSSGSKKLALKVGKHGRQRAAYGEADVTYSNTTMRLMSAEFKMV